MAEIESMLSLAAPDGPAPAIVKTVATADEGIAALLGGGRGVPPGAEDSGALAPEAPGAAAAAVRGRGARAARWSTSSAGSLTPEELERTVERSLGARIDPFTAADGDRARGWGSA